MTTEETLGKTITNIYFLGEIEVGGLDTGECFVELDNKIIIDIPFGYSDSVWVKELNKKAVSLFADLSDYPVYHVNKKGESIGVIAERYKKKSSNIFNRLLKFLLGYEIPMKEYQPYKVEYHENKLKHIKDRKIVDYLWYDDEVEKGFFLLDNGYLISETTIAFHGIGAGLICHDSIDKLTAPYLKLTEKKIPSTE